MVAKGFWESGKLSGTDVNRAKEAAVNLAGWLLVAGELER